MAVSEGRATRVVAKRSLSANAASRWRGIRRAFAKNPLMLLGFVIFVLIALSAVAAPLITFHDPVRTNIPERLEAPSLRHWFGTDHLGVDVYARTMYGGRVSLFVGVTVAVLVIGGGLFFGLISGYNRRLDGPIMRVADAIMAFPTLLLALAVAAALGGSIRNIILVLAVSGVPGMARLVRGQVLSLREQQFVEGAKAIGATMPRILLRHVAPNTFAAMMVMASLVFAGSIVAEAGLAFLGVGAPTFAPSWGNLIVRGRDFLGSSPWISFFPGVLLTLMVLAINVIGDGLRDALDPRLRRRL